MLPSFVLSVREGLEAALIIGIVLGALRKFERRDLAPTVWVGAGLAALISLLAAVALQAFGMALEDPGEAIFEGFTMLLAAGVLTWMIFWMQKQSRGLKGELEAGVRRAAFQKGRKALFLLAFVAVLREGIELALFLTASALAAGSQPTFWGGLLGLAAAAFLGWALFSSLVRLDLRRFFQVTGLLLILFAAGLVAHGVHEFNDVGWIPGVVEHLWDINPVLHEDSFTGQILKALFGYNGNPSLTEVLAYVGYFVVLLLTTQLGRRRLLTTPPARSA